jgi:energy-coupling factor transport system ATP-binding protein
LRSADLELQRGEIHALVGPNGGGKSTLALVLAGLIAPAGGALEAEGRSVSRKSGVRDRLRVGCVFQNPEHQFVAFTVEDELAYGLKREGFAPEEIKRRVEGMLERFRLTEFARTHPFRLSGGQKRRLSVATMLIEEPDLLILDEPTFGQDRETTRALTEEIRRLNERGLTLLLIAHDMRLVAETADRVTALKSGETRFAGSPRDLFARHDLMSELDLIPPPMAQLSSELRRRGIEAPLFLSQAEALRWLSRAREGTRENA